MFMVQIIPPTFLVGENGFLCDSLALVGDDGGVLKEELEPLATLLVFESFAFFVGAMMISGETDMEDVAENL